MKKALLASAACAALGLAAVSEAAVVCSAIDRGVPVSGATTATGYRGWTIVLTSDTGNISGVDIDSGGGGIFGQLIQRWTSSGEDGTYDTPSPNGNNQNTATGVGNLDSHVLNPGGNPANILSAVPPNEDAVFGATIPPFPANGPTSGFGRGTFIKGAFGIAGPAQSNTYQLAYIVIPEGSEASVVGSASVATAGGTFTVPIRVPEPGTISLVGLSALGLLARRRRD
jgi:hypothetical protein